MELSLCAELDTKKGKLSIYNLVGDNGFTCVKHLNNKALSTTMKGLRFHCTYKLTSWPGTVSFIGAGRRHSDWSVFMLY